jgi:uncharacterized SAM-binding protein YcdF (DUF218 family)
MLKNIITPFIMAPGIFIVFLLALGGWFLYRKNWQPGITNLIMGCLMWLVSIAPVSDGLLSRLESDYLVPKNPHGDVIILLGHRVYAKAPDLTGLGAPSDHMFGRVVTAVRLQKSLNVPIIVAGASVSPIVKRFLMDLGVPSSKIIIEDESTNTFQNAEFTSKICVMSGYEKPLLVTSAYHMRRALLSFEKAGSKVTPISAGFRTWPDKRYRWNEYLPGDFGKVSIAIKEWVGYLAYKRFY